MKIASIKKIALALALTLCLAFALTACFGGSLKMQSFTVDRSSIAKTSYYIGEEIDFTGLKAVAKYNDSKYDKEYTLDELTLEYDPDITKTVGSKKVTVSFMDPNIEGVKQSTEVTITVSKDPNAVELDRCEVSAGTMTTVYDIGDTVSFEGIAAKKIYNNSTEEQIPLADLTFGYGEGITEANLTSKAGDVAVFVYYDGNLIGTVAITVRPTTVTSDKLELNNVKTSYLAGETVDLAGISVTVNYSNGETLTYGYDKLIFTPALSTITLTAGEKQVSVKYTDTVTGAVRSLELPLTVYGISSYTINTEGMKTEYDIGDEISLEGLVIIANYSDGTSKKELSLSELEFDYSANITANAGEKTIIVKHNGATAGSIPITVLGEPTISKTEIKKDGVDLEYYLGETVNLNGISITVSYSRDDFEDASYDFDDFTFVTDLTKATATAGTQKVYFKYHDKALGEDITLSVDITVYGVKEYTVNTDEVDVEYFDGEKYSFEGLKVTVTYTDGHTASVPFASLTFDADESLTATAGEKKVNVYVNETTYVGNFTVKVTLNVIESVKVTVNKTVYYVGNTVDFSDIAVTLTYLNGTVKTLGYKDVSFTTTIADLTKSEGTKTVVYTFTDPIRAGTVTKDFTIRVDKAPKVVNGFQKPQGINAFDADNRTDNKVNYGESGFQGQFVKGGFTYTVGDDNAFKFIPQFTVYQDYINQNFTVETLAKFYSVATVSIYKDNAYVALTAEQDGANKNIIHYTLDGVILVDFHSYDNTYDFSTDAVGAQFKLSVLPSTEHYTVLEDSTVNPVVLEVKVIDAYNVYEANELSLIDNADGTDHIYFDNSGPIVNWVDFKLSHGINQSVNGIVLHCDLTLTADNVPSTFFQELKTDTNYINKTDGTVIPVKAGTKFLRDGSNLYIREYGEFVIEGNFFNIDASRFPLVASNGVLEPHYGSDFSNSTLFHFNGSGDTVDANWVTVTEGTPSKATIKNLSIVGNAGRNNIVDTQEKLVSAGGLIFVKANHNATLTCDNIIGNQFFITYFPDYDSEVTVDSVKCYDSYQNAMMPWGNTKVTVKNSFFNGAGGPLILAQSKDPTQTSVRNPSVTIINTVTETHLLGTELWFSATNATAIVTQVKGLGTLMENYGLGNIANKKGELNIIAALLTSGSDAQEIITNPYAQGQLMIDGVNGVNRYFTDTEWLSIVMHGKFAAGCGFLTAADANGNRTTIYNEGYGFFNALTGEAIGAAEIAAFQSAKYVTLSQGGISIIFELYH